MHVIPWHLRWGQALSEGVHVIVLLLQVGESHLLLMLWSVGIRGPQALQLSGQSATRGRYGTQNGHRRWVSLHSYTIYTSIKYTQMLLLHFYLRFVTFITNFVLLKNTLVVSFSQTYQFM